MTEARTLLARPAGFLNDVLAIAMRSLRAVARERDVLAVTLIFPPLFFAATVGSLEGLGTFIGISDFRAFQLPVIIVLAVTGVSRAMALVIDIQTGYFDRLLASPVNRAALLLGLMGADLVVVVAVSGFVLLMGLLFGVEIITGPVGVLVFLLLAGFWGLAFNGFLCLRVAYGQPVGCECDLRAVHAACISYDAFRASVCSKQLARYCGRLQPRHLRTSWASRTNRHWMGRRRFSCRTRNRWNGCLIVHPGVSGSAWPPQTRMRNIRRWITKPMTKGERNHIKNQIL